MSKRKDRSCGYRSDDAEEWLSLLKEANRKDMSVYDTQYEDRRTATLEWLGNSFYWNATPEGHDFWSYVYDRLCHISNLGRTK